MHNSVKLFLGKGQKIFEIITLRGRVEWYVSRIDQLAA